MLNPILNKSRSLQGYGVVWVLIAGIHGLVLTYFYDLPGIAAFVDSLIFNGLFSLFGLSLWYVVRYVNVERHGFLSILLNHLAAAVAVLLLWLWIGSSLLSLLPNTADTDPYFISRSLPWRVLVGLLFYTVITLFYYLVTYYTNFQEKIQQEAALNASVKEAELAMLRAQINPHFIFNTLNSISSLTMALPEKAQEMTIKLSDFLRYSLAQDSQQLTTLAEELRNVNLYLDIEKIRFGNRFYYEQQLAEECLDKWLPNMILQPLFENAIKHGVYEALEQVTIRFTCSMEKGFLKLSLWNDFDPDGRSRKGEGVGQKNIRARLLLLYGSQDLIAIRQSENTFEVTLRIPQLAITH